MWILQPYPALRPRMVPRRLSSLRPTTAQASNRELAVGYDCNMDIIPSALDLSFFPLLQQLLSPRLQCSALCLSLPHPSPAVLFLFLQVHQSYSSAFVHHPIIFDQYLNLCGCASRRRDVPVLEDRFGYGVHVGMMDVIVKLCEL